MGSGAGTRGGIRAAGGRARQRTTETRGLRAGAAPERQGETSQGRRSQEPKRNTNTGHTTERAAPPRRQRGSGSDRIGSQGWPPPSAGEAGGRGRRTSEGAKRERAEKHAQGCADPQTKGHRRSRVDKTTREIRPTKSRSGTGECATSRHADPAPEKARGAPRVRGPAGVGVPPGA